MIREVVFKKGYGGRKRNGIKFKYVWIKYGLIGNVLMLLVNDE